MQKKLETRNVILTPIDTNKESREKRRALLLIIAAASFLLLDQLLKWMAINTELRFSFGPFKYELFLNTGIVFSLPLPLKIYWPLALITLFGFLVGFFKAWSKKSPSTIGLGLIIFGACSNLLDRYLYNATIDYFIFFNRSAINVADGLIMCGVLLFILLRSSNKPTNTKQTCQR
jgi:lipoprotein signal peptidase